MRGMIEKSKFGGGTTCTLASQLEKYRKMMYNSNERNYTMGRRFGFTLAEVLITLAIIGVVAVLTIPTLVANYQEKSWNTSATVFERKLEESLKIMNTQGTLAGYKTTEAFVNELQKHLKITKVCKNDDILSCFEDKVMWGSGEAEPEEVDMSTIKTASHFGQSDWKTNVLGLQLANGTSALIAYNPECRQDPYSNQISGTGCVAVLYDTSGYAKPNTSGKDLRGINIAKLGKSCAFELGGTCYGTPFSPQALTQAECDSIKNDLGIIGCASNGDYWAGAVKACNGVSKMPTNAQLAEIANYLYNTDNIQADGDGLDLVLDSKKVSSIGLSAYGFYVWSGEAYGNDGAYFRIFSSTYTQSIAGDRLYNATQAICIVD